MAQRPKLERRALGELFRLALAMTLVFAFLLDLGPASTGSGPQTVASSAEHDDYARQDRTWHERAHGRPVAEAEETEDELEGRPASTAALAHVRSSAPHQPRSANPVTWVRDPREHWAPSLGRAPPV